MFYCSLSQFQSMQVHVIYVEVLPSTPLPLLNNIQVCAPRGLDTKLKHIGKESVHFEHRILESDISLQL
jgi:hypothetical protein